MRTGTLDAVDDGLRLVFFDFKSGKLEEGKVELQYLKW